MAKNRLSLRSRIFLYMILLVVVASVLIALVTIYQYNEQSRDYHEQRLDRKESQILSSIDYVLKQTTYPRSTEYLDLIFKDEIYKNLAEDFDSKTLFDLRRKLLAVDRNVAIPNLFEKLVEEKEHIALVVDEYGSISGLVTMEDVIETLLGLEIMDESDTDSDMQQLARKSWEKRAKRLGIIEDTTQD